MEEKQTIKEFNLQVLLAVNKVGLEQLYKKQGSMHFLREDGTPLSFSEVVNISNETMKKFISLAKIET